MLNLEFLKEMKSKKSKNIFIKILKCGNIKKSYFVLNYTRDEVKK